MVGGAALCGCRMICCVAAGRSAYGSRCHRSCCSCGFCVSCSCLVWPSDTSACLATLPLDLLDPDCFLCCFCSHSVLCLQRACASGRNGDEALWFWSKLMLAEVLLRLRLWERLIVVILAVESWLLVPRANELLVLRIRRGTVCCSCHNTSICSLCRLIRRSCHLLLSCLFFFVMLLVTRAVDMLV